MEGEDTIRPGRTRHYSSICPGTDCPARAQQDASLKRCFGIDKKVADCDWAYLSTLTTLREPKQSLPRLVDLLEYLARPEAEHIWLLLDVKVRENPGRFLPMCPE